jgi:para-aminobenzoate synthetase component I
MTLLTPEAFEQTTNQWGQQKVPFLFIVDFEVLRPIAIRLDALADSGIFYDVNGISNRPFAGPPKRQPDFRASPSPISLYRKKFQKVYEHLERGDSYLTNLTIRTAVTTDATLDDLFTLSRAKYKLLLTDTLLVFSPETFVQTNGRQIFAYPMKGTIDASLPDAANSILNDRKELAEHVTIVDLIRNDLSQVATNVRVENFRYLDRIATSRKHLLQVSSKIVGDLFEPFCANPGTLILKLLPAGSVSGAPKAKTVEIIQQAEGEKRGYYTGVFGIFDGHGIDSGVMIRYIEKENGKLFYRSGGGITTQSDCESEYHEAIDKIYVPFA